MSADPLDVLRGADPPAEPDPTFAATLRTQLTDALLTPGAAMTTTRPQNGTKAGDVSYVTLGVPDLAAAQRFYGAVLGWAFAPGGSTQGAQVPACAPMVGLWGGGPRTGATLAFRVDDLDAAVAAVRAHGGEAEDAQQRDYGLEATCRDPQGLAFWLHQLAEDRAPEAVDPAAFGRRHGDISYVSYLVEDVAGAQAFYAAVLGWAYADGDPAGTVPRIGMWGGPLEDPTGYGAVLSYTVDDLAAAVAAVRAGGGEAGEPEQRPYALTSQCRDDQGVAFWLHQY